MVRWYEIRVHGVSGTPPESMLDLGAIPPAGPARNERVVTYGPPSPLKHAEAYQWGRLTSGRPTTALWLVLLPFVLANVAGWAALSGDARPTLWDGPVRSRAVKAQVLLVRVAGLLLTALVAALLYLLVVDLTAWQWAVQRAGWVPAWWPLVVGQACAASLLLLLWWSTKLRPRPAQNPWCPDVADVRPESVQRPWSADRVDPAGYAWLQAGQEALWDHPGIIERLRATHLAVGLATLAGLSLLSSRWQPLWLTSSVILTIVLPIAVVGRISTASGRARVEAVAARERAVMLRWAAVPALAGAVLVMACVWFVFFAPPNPAASATQQAVLLEGPRGIAAGIGAVYAVLVLAIGAIAWRVRARAHPPHVPGRTAAVAPALLLISVGVTAVLGMGLAVMFVRQVGGIACRAEPTSSTCLLNLTSGPEWVGLGYTAILGILGIVTLVRFVIALRRCADPRLGPRAMQAIRLMVTAPARTLAWLVGVTLPVAGVLGVAGIFLVRTNPELPSTDELPYAVVIGWILGVLVAVPVVACAGMLLWERGGRARRFGIPALAVVIAGIAWAIAATEKRIDILGLALPPHKPKELFLLIALSAPVVTGGTRLVSAWRNLEVRRGVGVLWDLGLFWPRWFHPFTPPTYSDQAVTWLASRINSRLDDSDNVVVLSAHSQGSLLATAALLLLKPEHTARVGLLTYGSPWGRLYSELFPAVFDRQALDMLLARLGATSTRPECVRWRNLHRATDPIGGPLVGHEQRWLQPTLAQALETVEPYNDRGLSDTPQQHPDPRVVRPLLHSGYTFEKAYYDCRAEVLTLLGVKSES
jgi:hypothetical protein